MAAMPWQQLLLANASNRDQQLAFSLSLEQRSSSRNLPLSTKYRSLQQAARTLTDLAEATAEAVKERQHHSPHALWSTRYSSFRIPPI
eukprot:185845-Pleurochrysis_carterae.AAC.1